MDSSGGGSVCELPPRTRTYTFYARAEAECMFADFRSFSCGFHAFRIGSPVFVQTAGDVVAGPSSTSAAPRFTDAEIRRWAMPPLEPRLTLFAIGAPYGNLHNQVEKGRRRPKSGLGAAHKVANAVFHLRALQCLAVRCHACVQNASFATVLEDDVEFVDGVSPGSAEELP
eukprot:1892642-Pleurochrysis_carterae.AAC.3